MPKLKVEVNIASNDAQEGSDDDEIIVVPYVKPPPTIICLVESESDGEDTTSSSKHSGKKRKKKDKTDKPTKKSSKSVTGESDESPRKKTSKSKKGAKGKDKSDRLKNSNHKKKTKSSRDRSATENEDPANVNAAYLGNDRRKDKSGTDSGSGLTTTSNIFQPSSAALADSANSAHQEDRENGRKRKASGSKQSSKTKSPRVRTNSSKSAEEESHEDSQRFARRLGLPISPPLADSAREDTADLEDEPPRKKKLSKKSKRKRTKSRDDESESEVFEAVTEPDEVNIEEAIAIAPNTVSKSIESDHGDEETPPAVSENMAHEKEEPSWPIESPNQPHSDAGTVEQQQTEGVLEIQENTSAAQNYSSIKCIVPLPSIFPYKWTADMKRYYGESIVDTTLIENNQINNYGGKACRTCGRNPGEHVAAECSAAERAPVCLVCGSQGHSSPSQCRNTLCLSCGHQLYSFQRGCSKCTQQANPVKCSICGMTGHVNRDCPDHWRRYHNVTDFMLGDQSGDTENSREDDDQSAEGSSRKFKYVSRPNSSCANCGQRKHNYFHCNKPRMNADGSEYSIDKGSATLAYYPHKPFIVQKLTAADFKEIDLLNANCSHPNEMTFSPQTHAQDRAAANPVAVAAVQQQTVGSGQAVTVEFCSEIVTNVLELDQVDHSILDEAIDAVKHCFEEGVTLLSEYGKLQLKGPRDAIERSKVSLRIFMLKLRQDNKDAVLSEPRITRQCNQIRNPPKNWSPKRRPRYFEPEPFTSGNPRERGTGSGQNTSDGTIRIDSEGARQNSSTSSPRRSSTRSGSPFVNQGRDADLEREKTNELAQRGETNQQVLTDNTNSAPAQPPAFIPAPPNTVASLASTYCVSLASIFSILQPPPRPPPQYPSMTFSEDEMKSSFDVDERKFTVEDLAQLPSLPYLSLAFRSPTKEYIPVHLPVPIPVVTQPTANLSINVNSYQNLTVQNSASATQSTSTATAQSADSDGANNKQKQSGTSTSTPEPAPAKVVAETGTFGASASSNGSDGDKQPDSPEVIVLD